MRILLFSGKGGVGKTSLAAATGLELSRLGYRTLVMSVDPAHSLADAFDLETNLFHEKTGDPYPIDKKLAIHEVNIQKEIKRHWREISAYVISVLRTTGINDVEAEELAILPGMEELSALMYVNQFRREDRYDVIVLDCAPTAESMRFVSMPTTLEWYMKHIFPFQRNLLKAVRPLANRVSPVELPADSYFDKVKELFGRLDGIGELLEDPKFTCVLPAEVTDQYFQEWRVSQGRILEEIDRYFAPVPVKRVPLFTHEVLGRERLEELARSLYDGKEDPAAVTRTEAPYALTKSADGRYEVRLQLPFAAKGEIGLFKKGDELVVEIGTLRRHIGLPASMASLSPGRAKLENKILTVEMKET